MARGMVEQIQGVQAALGVDLEKALLEIADRHFGIMNQGFGFTKHLHRQFSPEKPYSLEQFLANGHYLASKTQGACTAQPSYLQIEYINRLIFFFKS